MRLFFDFFPIFLFFIVYKLSDIYYATGAAIFATAFLVGIYWLIHRRFELIHLITLGLISFLGGLTIFLHDPMFIKWKVSIVYWAFALVFFVTQYFGKKSILERMMSDKLHVPFSVWRKLNRYWVLFFGAVGFLNLWVVYHFSTNAWVNFKLYGLMGLFFVFAIAQAFYLSKHMEQN